MSKVVLNKWLLLCDVPGKPDGEARWAMAGTLDDAVRTVGNPAVVWAATMVDHAGEASGLFERFTRGRLASKPTEEAQPCESVVFTAQELRSLVKALDTATVADLSAVVLRADDRAATASYTCGNSEGAVWTTAVDRKAPR